MPTGKRRKKFNLVSWYRRFFLSERTATVSAVLALVVMALVLYFGIRAGALNMAGIYDLFIRFVLVTTLLYSIRTHKLLLMQATTAGLLFCMLCAQSQYALGELANVDSDTYITMGLQGFIFLAVERMILFAQSLVCFDYFAIYVARRQGEHESVHQPRGNTVPVGVVAGAAGNCPRIEL